MSLKSFFCTISMLKEEYRRQQVELEERKAAQEAEAQRQFEQQLLLQKQQAELEAARVAAAAHAQESPARDLAHRGAGRPQVPGRHLQVQCGQRGAGCQQRGAA